MIKHYKKRDAYKLDCESVGDKSYYSAHILAMTGEQLHSKSDIAAELAVRDAHIDYLIAELESATGVSHEFIKCELPQFEIE